MIVLQKQLKLFFTILFASFFMLGCSVTFYKSGNASLYDAAMSESKTKIIKKDGKREKYSKINQLDTGEFYGIKRKKGKKTMDSIFIDEITVKKVMLENKKLNSTIYDISYGMAWVGGFVLAIVYVYPWMFG